MKAPLHNSALILSFGILALTLALGTSLIGSILGIIIGLSSPQSANLELVNMVIRVFALLGLLYLPMAFIHKQPRIGYGAVAMLLSAFLLWQLYIQQLTQLQLYAMPAGAYLLAISYLEWNQNNKNLARWIDYTALTLLIGSLLWQTLLLGWWYYLILIMEGLLIAWWGAARRLRRLLYGGMLAIVLGTMAQLVNAIIRLITNQWLIFGIIGLVLVAIAVIVERKLEDLRAWQESLEAWE